MVMVMVMVMVRLLKHLHQHQAPLVWLLRRRRLLLLHRSSRHACSPFAAKTRYQWTSVHVLKNGRLQISKAAPPPREVARIAKKAMNHGACVPTSSLGRIAPQWATRLHLHHLRRRWTRTCSMSWWTL